MLHPSQWFGDSVCAIAFALAFAAWWVTEWFYVRLGRDPGREVKDQGSRFVATVGTYTGVGMSVLAAALGWGWTSASLQLAGVGLMVLGMLFRGWALYTLGRHFSVHVASQPEHRLITGGPYRWLRHPSYTGTLLTVMGVPMALGLWPLSPVAGALFIFAHCYRIRVEEIVLTEMFGGDYQEYCRRTWRLFPGW